MLETTDEVDGMYGHLFPGRTLKSLVQLGGAVTDVRADEPCPCVDCARARLN